MTRASRPGGDGNLDPLQWAQLALGSKTLHETRAGIKKRLSGLIHVNSLLITVGMRTPPATNEGETNATTFRESAGVLVSREWTEYLSAGEILHDPMVKRIGATQHALFWWENSPLHRSMNDEDRRFARHYFDHDIRLGIVDGCARSPGDVSELIALDSRASFRDFQEFRRVHGQRLQLAVAWLWEAIRLRELDELHNATRLAPRERECLTWASSGMTSSDIAQRLNLSSTTVNEYLASAMKRLGARTRVQTCARATLLGLIAP
jgi:DNA-binding CsgD family transcriptional regulator